MYVVIELDTYASESFNSGSVSDVYGPFENYNAAREYVKIKEAEDHYALYYTVYKIIAPA